MAMVQIICQDCGEDMELVRPQEVEERIASGQYVKGYRLVTRNKTDGEQFQTTEKGIFAICKSCAGTVRAITDMKAQNKRIQERLALIHETRKDLTLEQAVHAAVEDEFDPHNEPNLAFRAWLLENVERDKSRDADVAATFGDGPHAGGAA